MTRSHAAAVLSAALFAASVQPTAAQQPATTILPAPQVVGPTGPGLQPQINTSPYQRAVTPPAARGVNPFAGPAAAPVYPVRPRLAPRLVAPPAAFAPAPVPGVANNPAVFNPGFAVPFPVPIPPALAPVTGVAYNPVLVSQRGVVSAYYVPPTPSYQPSSLRPPVDEEPFIPTAHAEAADPWYGTFLRAGEHRFLPWVW